MSAPAVLFTDVAAVLVAKAKPLLATKYRGRDAVTLATVMPTTRPARMVTFRRDGGPRRDAATELARVGVNCWGTSDIEANALTNYLRAVLPLVVDGDPICRITETSGPIDIAAASGQARRYFTLEVVARGTQIA